VLRQPIGEAFFNEVQLIQLKEDCSHEEAQLGYLSTENFEDGIILQVKTQVDFN